VAFASARPARDIQNPRTSSPEEESTPHASKHGVKGKQPYQRPSRRIGTAVRGEPDSGTAAIPPSRGRIGWPRQRWRQRPQDRDSTRAHPIRTIRHAKLTAQPSYRSHALSQPSARVGASPLGRPGLWRRGRPPLVAIGPSTGSRSGARPEADPVLDESGPVLNGAAPSIAGQWAGHAVGRFSRTRGDRVDRWLRGSPVNGRRPRYGTPVTRTR
jgi:hypothetical protein